MNGIRAALLTAALAVVGCAAQRQANRDVQTTAGAGQDITDDLASGATSSGSPSNAVIVPQSPSGPAPTGGVNPSGATLAGTPDSSGPMSVTSGSSGALSPPSESAGSTENSMAPRDSTGEATTAGATPSTSETYSTGNDPAATGTGGSGAATETAPAAGDISAGGATTSAPTNTNVGAPAQPDPNVQTPQSSGNVGASSTDADTEETTDDRQQ